jgi:hypothetical protein
LGPAFLNIFFKRGGAAGQSLGGRENIRHGGGRPLGWTSGAFDRSATSVKKIKKKEIKIKRKKKIHSAGFEPANSERPDLKSGAFDRSATSVFWLLLQPLGLNHIKINVFWR